jgi:hypothetical protein
MLRSVVALRFCGPYLANRVTARPETPPDPQILIPFPRDPDFVLRQPVFDHIEQKCAVLGSWAALVGLGGVGLVLSLVARDD